MTDIELISDLETRLSNLKFDDNQELVSFKRRLKMVVNRLFGDLSDYFAEIDAIQFYFRWLPPEKSELYKRHFDNPDDVVWESAKDDMRLVLTAMKDEIEIFRGGEAPENSSSVKVGISTRVFVVHGHDEAMKQSAARVLEKLGLEPVILHEQPNRGRTIIEKFTHVSNVGFAIILLSPDDLGNEANKQPVFPKLRARQNVILEMGFFLGKLGRDKVFVLYPETQDFELPSDYAGVLYTKYDAAGRWQLDLVQELKAAGYDVDANKLLRSN